MALSGTLSDLSLADLLQVCALNVRTCRVIVDARAGHGEIFVDTGEVVHAVFGDLFGREAVYALLAEDDAHFSVEADRRTRARTVGQRWEELAMESARRRDEGSLNRPLPPPAPPVPSAEPPRALPRRRVRVAMTLGAAALLGGHRRHRLVRTDALGRGRRGSSHSVSARDHRADAGPITPHKVARVFFGAGSVLLDEPAQAALAKVATELRSGRRS